MEAAPGHPHPHPAHNRVSAPLSAPAPACPQFGHIILTTSQGIMDHEEARRKKVGGKVLGFFY
jgi:small subunit ribosomal protein S15Ae